MSIEDKIIALLNKTIENGATEAEAALASAKAAELIIKYGIKNLQKEKEVTYKEYYCFNSWQKKLAKIVSIVSFCDVIERNGNILFIGEGNQPNIAQELYYFLVMQVYVFSKYKSEEEILFYQEGLAARIAWRLKEKYDLLVNPNAIVRSYTEYIEENFGKEIVKEEINIEQRKPEMAVLDGIIDGEKVKLEIEKQLEYCKNKELDL